MRVLLTGASGGIGSRLRALLKPLYPDLVLSDVRALDDLDADENFIAADLADFDQVAAAVRGMDAIVHLGGISTEAPWDAILQANIIGAYNLYEAARQAGVKRIVFASSNHAVGFYPRSETTGANVTPLPDSRYGLSKVFGEGLGALYAMKHGIGTLAIRIGNVADEPIDKRRLAIWLKPEDLVQLIRIGLEMPNLTYEVVYGASDNERGWWDNRRAVELGFRPKGRSEDFATEVLAREPATADPIAEHFQGGTLCSAEYDADKF